MFPLRNRLKTLTVLSVLCLFGLSGCGGGSNTPPDTLPHRDAYTITDLGSIPQICGGGACYTDTLNNSFSDAFPDPALSNSGAVAHEYVGAAGFWQSGKDRSIGKIGGSGAIARAVNENGQVVGTSDTGQKFYLHGLQDKNNQYSILHAFLWQNGHFNDLGTLPGATTGTSEALAVNNNAQVVGYSDTSDASLHAFLWQGGTMTDLGKAGSSIATSINAAGQVVGVEGNTASLWQNGQETDLGTLPGHDQSYASHINNQGQISGASGSPSYSSSSKNPQHAVLWQNTKIQDLGTLGGPSSQGFGNNNAGQVVGRADTAALIPPPPPTGPPYPLFPSLGPRYVSHAFLYTNGVMTDLNTLIKARSGWTLYLATAINDRGQIAGYGTVGGQSHFVLLTPK